VNAKSIPACLFAACAFWMFSAGVDAAERFALGGHTLGDRIERIQQDPRFRCEDQAACLLYSVCLFDGSDAGEFKGASIQGLALYYTGERLSGIEATFAESQFDRIVESLLDEYGPGKEEAGKSPANPVYLWREGSRLLRLERLSGDTNRSSVIVSEKSFLSEMLDR
jgi:hypothetical protein